MTQLITTAMILAAGRGERLRPLTDTTPKPLIEIAGKKLIEYHIENLAAADIKNIVINTAWLADKIHDEIGDGSRYGINITYSDETEALETAGGIINALPVLGENPFIVVNSDIWCDFDFSRWTDRNVSSQAHLLLVNNPDHNPDGDFSISTSTTELVDDDSPMYTYSGIGIYTHDFFASTPSGVQALAPIIRNKIKSGLVTAQVYNGDWTDVGTVGRLQLLIEKLESTE